MFLSVLPLRALTLTRKSQGTLASPTTFPPPGLIPLPPWLIDLVVEMHSPRSSIDSVCRAFPCRARLLWYDSYSDCEERGTEPHPTPSYYTVEVRSSACGEVSPIPHIRHEPHLGSGPEPHLQPVPAHHLMRIFCIVIGILKYYLEHADRGRVPGRRRSDARHVQGQFSNLRNPPPIQHSNEARAPPGRKLTPLIFSLVIF